MSVLVGCDLRFSVSSIVVLGDTLVVVSDFVLPVASLLTLAKFISSCADDTLVIVLVVSLFCDGTFVVIGSKLLLVVEYLLLSHQTEIAAKQAATTKARRNHLFLFFVKSFCNSVAL